MDGLADPQNLDILRKVFTDPYALKPGLTTEGVTKQAAELIGQLADGMRVRDIPAPQAAHFLMKLMFCMFAEDIGLLPGKVFSRVMETATKGPGGGMPDAGAGPRLSKLLRGLFESMSQGGLFGTDDILHFNGGLFADADVIELDARRNPQAAGRQPAATGAAWSRRSSARCSNARSTRRSGLKSAPTTPAARTSRRCWNRCDAAAAPRVGGGPGQVRAVDGGRARAKTPAAKRKKVQQRDKTLRDFVERLAHVTILDPACGSGNFLYVALHLLLDLEKEVITYAAHCGIGLLPQVRPTQLAGIEINPYAQELASVVIWIGYLQWMHDNGFNPPDNPVLEPIESIRRMDAILDLSDPENPKEPRMARGGVHRGESAVLGRQAAARESRRRVRRRAVRHLARRVACPTADLCCYWFEKAGRKSRQVRYQRAGLLATQGIRGGANREVLKRIKETGDIFFAESDRDWILDGANVHVRWSASTMAQRHGDVLDGSRSSKINANLTATADVTGSEDSDSKSRLAFMGGTKGGPFDMPNERRIEASLRRPTAAAPQL